MKENFADVVKYWPKESQMLAQVTREDNRITVLPQNIINEIGVSEESCVVFSAFAAKNPRVWERNFLSGNRLIEELQQNFTHYHGQDRKIDYVVRKIPGLFEDDRLFQ